MTMVKPEASMMPPATEDQRFPHSATLADKTAAALADIHTWEKVVGSAPAFWTQIDQAISASADPDALAGRMHETFAASIKTIVRTELAVIADALDADIVEVDPAKKPAVLANYEIDGWFETEPTRRLIFPAGQPLLDRLGAARKIAADWGVTA